MDEASVRQQLKETRERKGQLAEELGILESLESGFEGWLRLHGHPDAVMSRNGHGNKPKGSLSLRNAIKQVLAQAGNQQMHTKDIYAGTQRLGALTDSKNPLNVVDLHLMALAKLGEVTKVAPRTWRVTSTANAEASAWSSAGQSRFSG